MTPRYFPPALGAAIGLTAGLVAFIPSQAAPPSPAVTPPRLEAPAAKPAKPKPARPPRKEAR